MLDVKLNCTRILVEANAGKSSIEQLRSVAHMTSYSIL